MTAIEIVEKMPRIGEQIYLSMFFNRIAPDKKCLGCDLDHWRTEQCKACLSRKKGKE